MEYIDKFTDGQQMDLINRLFKGNIYGWLEIVSNTPCYKHYTDNNSS